MQQTSINLPEVWPDRLALVDCETTGGKAQSEAITELAIILLDHGQVSYRWQSLLNPGKPIPASIVRLTGISDEMVAKAPDFESVASFVHALLKDRVLVAHNARFDYSFLRQSFNQAGISYQAKTLCTVKLDQYLLPQLRSHSLEAIIRRLQIPVNNRHRAEDDCEALLWLLNSYTEQFDAAELQAACDLLLKQCSWPSQLPLGLKASLPTQPGIYRFYGEGDQLLYVGKSVNIRQRVMSHFQADHQQPKAMKISQRIRHVDYQVTAGDFSAQLLEAQTIKTESPLLNRQLRRNRTCYVLRQIRTENAYTQLSIVALTELASSDFASGYGLFRSRRQARAKLEQLVSEHRLCPQLNGLEPVSGRACFAYQLKRCSGACCEQDAIFDYNTRIEQALSSYRLKVWPWSGPILVEEGRGEQRCYHRIDQWRYQGCATDQDALEQLMEAPQAADFDIDIYHILVRFLLSEQRLKLNQLTLHNL